MSLLFASFGILVLCTCMIKETSGAVIPGQWPAARNCTCRELLSNIIIECCRRGFCNMKVDGLGIGEDGPTKLKLLSGKYQGIINMKGHSGPNSHYLHLIMNVSTTMDVIVFQIGKRLLKTRINSMEWHHISTELPKFSNKYTIGIILAATENNTEYFNLEMEIFVATTDQLPIICGERSCDNHPNITDVSASIGPFSSVISYTSSSSASIALNSSVISHTSSSSILIGSVSSVIGHTSSFSPVISHTSSSSASTGSVIIVTPTFISWAIPTGLTAADNTHITDLLVVINLILTALLVIIILLYITRTPKKIAKLCHYHGDDDDVSCRESS